MAKRILITGAAGFIGSNLSIKLVNEGNDVTGVDNLSFGFLKNLEEFPKSQISNLLSMILQFLLISEYLTKYIILLVLLPLLLIKKPHLTLGKHQLLGFIICLKLQKVMRSVCFSIARHQKFTATLKLILNRKHIAATLTAVV